MKAAAFAALGTAIGWAQTDVTVDLAGGTGDPNAAFGTDGPGTVDFDLVPSGGGAFSGTATNLMDTATGETIYLDGGQGMNH